jgi:hypothetical protein
MLLPEEKAGFCRANGGFGLGIFKFLQAYVPSMSIKFETFLCDYLKGRVGIYKKYLLALLDNKEGCVWYLLYSEGMIVPNSDLKNLELLRDAGLVREDTRISRNGRNTYKLFFLTDNGRKIAEEMKAESIVSEDDKLLNPITFLAH